MTRIGVPEDEIAYRFSRSGGPGGQNVNRRSTKVELLFDVTSSRTLNARQRALVMDKLSSRIDDAGVLHVVSQAGRTQGENRTRARERLEALLSSALAAPPPKRVPTKPSRAAKTRRIESKRLRGVRKQQRARPSTED